MADIVAIVSALALVWQLVSKKDIPQSILAVFLCALTLVSIATVFRLDRQLAGIRNSFARQVAVSGAMPSYAEAAAGFRQAAIAALSKDASAYVRELKSALKSLAKGFNDSTGVECRVTIKEVYAPEVGKDKPEDLAVRTVCSSVPGQPKAREGVDWVRENTDFLEILAENKLYFLGQDLPKLAKRGVYRNSHWDGPTVATETFDYRSTIVWPIGAQVSDSADNGEQAIVGFLCLDSKETEKFDPVIDVPTGQAFAASAYIGLNAYIEDRELKVTELDSEGARGAVDVRAEQ